MIKKNRVKGKIRGLLKEYFLQQRKSIPIETRVPLSAPSYGFEEVWEAVDSFLTTRVTMGEKVHEFEKMFSDYIGVTNAVMVNSGSSANLLALSILANPLTENRIKQGDEIITPAVTWSTTVFPIINIGAMPVLVDIDLGQYTVNPNEIEKAITKRTKAIMPVHLLGNSCDMKRILEISEKHGLFVIEDACEAHGAEFGGKRVGSFGDLATFSFFFSHHISTIEGGMILTDKDEYAELARSLRAHGWVRDLEYKEKITRKYAEIDERFLFANIGFNVRPTEIQGAFGIHQIKKLDKFIKRRENNAKFWTKRLGKYSDYLLLPERRDGVKHVWFGYPVTIRRNAQFSKKELVNFLEKKGVETRPIMSGNITEHPVMRLFRYRKVGNLTNSRTVMRRSFYWGNHHAIGKREREYLAECIDEFMERVG